MNWLTLDFHLTNDGMELFTHWVEIAVPARTLYLALVIWVGYKTYKKLQERKAN